MPIKNLVVNCTDVQRSVEYYTKFLELPVVGEPTPERAVLDAVTATIELRAVGNGRDQTTWSPDDLQKGFRHIGFKVDRLDERAAYSRRPGSSSSSTRSMPRARSGSASSTTPTARCWR